MALEGIRGDIAIYARDGDGKWWKKAGFWCSATYRVGAFAHRVENRPLKYAILAAHKLLASPWRVLKGVHIPHNAIIGPGLRIPHPQNIIIAPGGVFGSDCSIYQDGADLPVWFGAPN